MWAHTEKQKVVGGFHSTFQGFEAGGKLENLSVPQACASSQKDGPLASLGGQWHEAAEGFQVWVQGPS